MAHLIESMFSVRETPWHGLGRVLQQAPTAEEAIKAAGLDWTVNREKVYIDVAGVKVEVPSHKAIVRSDTNATLNILSNNFKPLQNVDAFGWFNPFIEQGLATFTTAGSLREGRTVWVLAELSSDQPLEIGKGGDYIKRYILLAHGHDGNMAVRAGLTLTRVVCNNTLQAAMSSEGSKLIRIKHSGNLDANLKAVRSTIDAVNGRFAATAEQYKAMSNKQINQQDLQNYVDHVFDLTVEGTDREMLRTNQIRETITALFENGAGAHLASSRGTAFGAYNAVTNYLTHIKGTDADSRLNSGWFGENNRVGEKALEAAFLYSVAQ